MTIDEQIWEWVAGNPKCPNDRGECCPDFSCCRRHLLWPLAKRVRFEEATQAEREAMLPDALAALLVDSGTDAAVLKEPK